jgi:hypothetical protein
MNPPEAFYPSTEYQPVPSWVVLPAGAIRDFDYVRGVPLARWNPPVPPPQSVIDNRTGKPQQIPIVGPAPVETTAKDVPQQPTPEAKGTEKPSQGEVSYAQDEPKTKAQPHGDLPTFSFPPRNRRPCFVNYWSDFLVESRHYKAGVYYHHLEEKQSADGPKTEVLVNSWICSPLEVMAITRIEGCKENSYIIEYIAHGEKDRRRFLLPQSLVVGRTDDVAKILRDRGVSVFRGHKTIVCQYLDREHRRFGAHRLQDF